MAAILPNYEYDIFISYRQNDNKYDGWVTEFVENLRKELAATFKEEINIYFDENPHDGLLETHNVSKSLKGKLQSLVFIPIISQTYCDPKSFAWQHEFCAFNKIASHDSFGKSIRLASGNIADRILPVQIHDLDQADKELYESIGEAVLRPVDFIYSIPGVNRPLRAVDDEQIKSPDQILYRDQINKVARAIKELIEALRSPDMVQEVPMTLDKEEEENTIIISDSTKEPSEHKTGEGKKRKAILYMIAVIGLLVLAYFSYNWLDQRSKVKWARTEALPQIKSAIESQEINWQTYSLIEQTIEHIPDDPDLNKYIAQATYSIDFHSDPPGATVFGQDYLGTSDNWIVLGKTPLNDVRIPRSKASKFKFELDGYTISEQPYYNIMQYFGSQDISVILHQITETPAGMVFIKGDTSKMSLVGYDHLPEKVIGDFWIDKFEVTNKEYKLFVDERGYLDQKYWKYRFIDNDRELSFNEAMDLFTDKTGLKGPAVWEAGSYPNGQKDFPVSGLSWYEAAAYTEFVGKELPSIYHWNHVANTYSSGTVVPISNLRGSTPLKVGESGSMNTGGTYDLSGNVREWVYNKESKTGGRFILGGGWNDAAYAFTDAYNLPPLSRSATNGIRCIQPIDTTGNGILMAELENPTRDFSREQPIDEDMFNLLVRQYSYDNSELEPALISVDSTNEYWIKQKVEINAAYRSERIPV